MAKQFKEGKQYIFRSYLVSHKEKYTIKWYDEIDSMEVQVINKTAGMVNGYAIDPKWCEEER